MRNIMRSALGLGVPAALMLFVPVAQAGTVEVVGGTAVFTAAPGEANDVRAGTGLHAAPGFPLKVIDSGAPLTAGPGCVQLDASSAQCPASTANSPLVIRARDGDDHVFVDDAFSRPDVEVRGGSGNDDLHVGSAVGTSPLLYGGSGDDTLSVSNNITGTPTMRGGPGDDTLSIAEDGGGLLHGGSGEDHLIVGGGIHKFATIQLDGGRGNDSYEFGSLTPDPVSTLVAGRGFDTLDLSPLGAHGAVIDLNGCAGCVEQVVGTAADDQITGDAGPEIILAGDGNDIVDGGGGPDAIAGQGGDDTITSRDGTIDAVGCGSGTDAVVADRFDLLSDDCESVSRPAARAVVR